MSQALVLAGIPKHDLVEFAALPDALKDEVLDLVNVLRDAASQESPRTALAAAAQANAHRRGWSMKRLEAHYYAVRNGAGWRALINGAKLPGGGKRPWLTAAVIEAWRAICMQHFRSYRSAYFELVADYKSGRKVGDVDWRMVWGKDPELRLSVLPQKCPPGMPLPPGWSYHNFMRFKPPKVEELGARIGRRAAKELARPVRTTRALLLPGQQYEFDDLWHDMKVMIPDQTTLVRPLELACLDVASGHKVAYGLRPGRMDDARARQNIRERDMRLLLAHVLCNIGYHRDGCALLVENGTAAIRDWLAVRLAELAKRPDGTPLITVHRSGVDKRNTHLAQWGAAGGGNFRAKAHLESSHNLAHNRLDNLPAQTGSNSRINAPEELEGADAISTKLLLAGSVMPADLAKRLQFPALDWGTLNDAIGEAYFQIATTHDHALEGWTTAAHFERQWRCHKADVWHSEEDWHALTDEQRAALAPIVMALDMNRVARKSRLQMWQHGEADLIRLPEHAIALICGGDLAEERPCPANGEVLFTDKSISLAPLVYNLRTCVGPNGARCDLQEKQTYLWLINPFDAGKVFVMDIGGAYIGRCDAVSVPDRRDMAAVHEAMGKAERDFNEAIKPLATRGARLAKARLQAFQNNTQLLLDGSRTEVAPKKSDAQVAQDEAAIDAVLNLLDTGSN